MGSGGLCKRVGRSLPFLCALPHIIKRPSGVPKEIPVCGPTRRVGWFALP
jgi:hypothetical protein